MHLRLKYIIYISRLYTLTLIRLDYVNVTLHNKYGLHFYIILFTKKTNIKLSEYYVNNGYH